MSCSHDVVYFGLCALCGAEVEATVATSATANNSANSQSAEATLKAQLQSLYDRHDASDELDVSSPSPINPKFQINSSNLSDNEKSNNNFSHQALVVGARTLHLTSAAFANQVSSNMRALYQSKRLLLVLDLDHTLIHTTDDFRVAASMPALQSLHGDLHSFTLDHLTSKPSSSPKLLHHFVKLRPHVKHFLDSLSSIYDLHVYTMGSRPYAERILDWIDNSHSLVKHRVVTRTETSDISFKALERLYACDDSMIGIVDDRTDVWRNKQENVLRVWDFTYFATHELYDRHKQIDAMYDGKQKETAAKQIQNKISSNQSRAESDKISVPMKPIKEKLPLTTESSDSIPIVNSTELSKSSPNEEELKQPDTESTEPSILSPSPSLSPSAMQPPKSVNSSSMKRRIPRKPVPLWNDASMTETAQNTEEKMSNKTETNDSEELISPTMPQISSASVANESSRASSPEEEKSAALPASAMPETQKRKPKKSVSFGTNSIAPPAPAPPSPSSSPPQSPPFDPLSFVLPAHRDPQHGDNVLLSLLSVLQAAHTLFYDQFTNPATFTLPLPQPLSLPAVFAKIRSSVLNDCHFVFSGLMPSGVKCRDHDIGKMARQFGAKVYETIDEQGFAVDEDERNDSVKPRDRITHIIAWRDGSTKTSIGQKLAANSSTSSDAPFIVSLSWLYHSVTHYQRARESLHPLSLAKEASVDEKNRGVVDAKFVQHAERIVTKKQIIENILFKNQTKKEQITKPNVSQSQPTKTSSPRSQTTNQTSTLPRSTPTTTTTTTTVVKKPLMAIRSAPIKRKKIKVQSSPMIVDDESQENENKRAKQDEIVK